MAWIWSLMVVHVQLRLEDSSLKFLVCMFLERSSTFSNYYYIQDRNRL